MHRGASVIAAVLAVGTVLGCQASDCIEPTTDDKTPAALVMTIIYRPPSSADFDTLSVSSADSTRHVDADNEGGVRVRYVARDPEGLRRVQLGAAVLTTVGVGIESKRADVDPVTSSCAVASLAGTWTAPAGHPGRSLSLGLVAENWVGLLTSTQTVTIRLR